MEAWLSSCQGTQKSSGKGSFLWSCSDFFVDFSLFEFKTNIFTCDLPWENVHSKVSFPLNRVLFTWCVLVLKWLVSQFNLYPFKGGAPVFEKNIFLVCLWLKLKLESAPKVFEWEAFIILMNFPNAKSAILKFCDLSVIFLVGMTENYNLTCPR